MMTGVAAEAPMRVLVAEDVMLTRAGIVHVLAGAGFDVVGQAEDIDGLLRLVRGTEPDAAIVDIRMPRRALSQ
jgi:DNA-binding NarL/FixJ family response regulator